MPRAPENPGELHQLIELCYRSSLSGDGFPALIDAVQQVLAHPATPAPWSDLIAQHLRASSEIARTLPQPVPALQHTRELSAYWTPALERSLRRSFGLSQSELAILQGLVDRQSSQDIARARRRSVHTVRTQIKQLLHKTQCRSQTELVQLATSVMLLPKAQADCTSASAPSTATSTALGHTEYGSANGEPWVFLHSAILGPQLPPAFDHALAEANLRLLAPARPGYPGSTAHPALTQPDDLAPVMCRWLDQLGLDQVNILGSVVGAMHAHALACRCPQRIQRLVLCAGTVPLAHAGNLNGLPASRRFWAELARDRLNLLTPLSALGERFFADEQRAGTWLNLAYRKHPRDLASVQSSALRPTLLAAARTAIDAGGRNFVREAHWQMSDWRTYLDHAVPTTLLHGQEDDIVPCSTVQQIYAERDNCQLVRVPAAGQLLLYQQPAIVIQHMAGAAAG